MKLSQDIRIKFGKLTDVKISELLTQKNLHH